MSDKGSIPQKVLCCSEGGAEKAGRPVRPHLAYSAGLRDLDEQGCGLGTGEDQAFGHSQQRLLDLLLT